MIRDRMTRLQHAAARVKLLRRLFGDVRGATLPMMAVAMIPTVAATGAAIDLGRAYLVKSQLSAAVDAAALAGGRNSTSTEARDAQIDQYFNANFPDGYLGTSLLNLEKSPEQVPDPLPNTVNVEVTARVSMPTLFMKLFGYTAIPISASAQAETGRNYGALQAVLVLDNTGSMASSDAGGGKSRIEALREAAKSFVNTILNEDADQETIAIGFVPYNTSVNVGRLIKSQYLVDIPGFTNVAATNARGWAGCVEAGDTIADVSSATTVMESDLYDTNDGGTPDGVTVPKIRPLLVPPIMLSRYQSSSSMENWYTMPTKTVNISGTNYTVIDGEPWTSLVIAYYHGSDRLAGRTITVTSGGNTYVNVSRLRARFRSSDSWLSYSSYFRSPVVWSPTGNRNYPSPNMDCVAEARVPQWGDDPTTLSSWIDDNNHAINPGLGTHSNIGMTWGYRMLRNPELFTSITPENPDGRPETEAIILMTDGFINYISNFDSLGLSNRTVNDPYPAKTGSTIEIGHGYHTAYRLPFEKNLTQHQTNTSTYSWPLSYADHYAESQMALRLLKVCEAARKAGIRVYTIAFKIDADDETTRDIYKQCATTESYFYDTADSTELSNAFREIAVDLVQLQLTK